MGTGAAYRARRPGSQTARRGRPATWAHRDLASDIVSRRRVLAELAHTAPDLGRQGGVLANLLILQLIFK
eukprot:5367782-Prymnesium_polylepis.1